MPSWNQVLDEMQNNPSPFDYVRRKYLRLVHEHTGRNIIAYYSGWLQKPGLASQGVRFGLDEVDKSGFMTAIFGLDRAKGLDLMLHTPGGEIAALEGLVDYLRLMFGKDVRAIVPQIAMSAGTMLALTCKSVVMGKHSSLGPIDPQIAGLPAHGIIEEFERARGEIQSNQAAIPLWAPIISKYMPTLVGQCQKAIKLSDSLVQQWLTTNMLDGDAEATTKAQRIVSELGSHASTLTHDRRISIDRVIKMGVKVERLEDDGKLQDMVLSAHHAYLQTFAETSVTRIIENHNGIAFMQNRVQS